MQSWRGEGKHMSEDIWEYSGLNTASRSLIQWLTLLYIAPCIPKPVKVSWTVYMNQTPTSEERSFHSLPSPYSKQKVVNHFRARQASGWVIKLFCPCALRSGCQHTEMFSHQEMQALLFLVTLKWVPLCSEGGPTAQLQVRLLLPDLSL